MIELFDTRIPLLAAALGGLFCGAASANEPLAAEHLKFFEAKVRPLLLQRCISCHGEDQQKGELRLDSRAAILKGGSSGPAIEPGKPGESLLVEAIRYESYEMPPSEQLPAGDIATLVRWVEMGAPWPGGNGAVLRRGDSDKITAEDRAWWAFQPVQEPALPPIKDASWARNEIDRFVLARLEAEGMQPAAEADRTTLIRRLYFDLVGLPPTPEEVAAFVADESPQAYERLVNRLLDSPRYGERWARHWLDLVRYADSDGYRADHYRPSAWRYRDYVIDSFNADKPYDRFVREQLAGDELFPGDTQALIATGYLRHWIYEYNNRDARGQWETVLTDLTDTTADVFLGMGMQCARCHDHKFDPILQKDYFRLQAFLAPILPRDDQVALGAAELQAYERELAAWETKTAEIRNKIAAIEGPYRERAAESAIEKFPGDIQAMYRKPAAERLPLEQQLCDLVERQVYFEYDRLESRMKPDHKEQVLTLRKSLAAFDKQKPTMPAVMSASDVGAEAPPTFIPGRSQNTIAPGFLTLLDPEPAKIEAPAIPNSTGRRSALALWLTQPENPLSTRVITNRIWQYHFGQGLAANASDLGRLGEKPTHPELLDWLTARFVRDGWSFKKLHQRIVTSATYRQSSAHPQFAAQQTRDPENSLYWRAQARRLDAEQIRDALLAATGQLDLTTGGPGVNPDTPRRSIYTRIMRNSRDPLLDVFDLPQFFSSESARNTTTTPVQSLLLFNSAQMLRHAGKLAARAKTPAGAGLSEAVDQVWKWAYGRGPTSAEREASLAFLKEQADRIRGAKAGESEAVASAATNLQIGKVPYRDGQAVLLKPDGPSRRFVVPHDPHLNAADFTVEAFFQIRSIYESGSVRTIVSKWNGSGAQPGWAFGVTGRGSRRKPQTLVLQMHGMRQNGTFGEAAIFSDQHIEINKPYYAAASVSLATKDKPGVTRFYLKDISNDDEPLLTAEVAHEIVDGIANSEPLAMGGRSNPATGLFDGLLDDVRLSKGALELNQLLYSTENASDRTLGYWQFEVEPGVFRDTSAHGLDIVPGASTATIMAPEQRAFVDFCHAVLNSNEFLYVP